MKFGQKFIKTSREGVLTTQPESYHQIARIVPPDSFCWNSPQDRRLEKAETAAPGQVFLAVWRQPSDSCFQKGIRQAFNTPRDSRMQVAVRRRIFFLCGSDRQTAVSRQVSNGQFQQKQCRGIHDPRSVVVLGHNYGHPWLSSHVVYRSSECEKVMSHNFYSNSKFNEEIHRVPIEVSKSF